MTLSAGTRLGPYEIVAPLGAGGMGEVYRARDGRLDRDVAIKVLPERLATDPAALSRFEREAKAIAAISHPNILAIHDFGNEHGVAFAVMELLEGETLRNRLAAVEMPWRESVEIAVPIADGLAAAHSRGIVHRDLKPENVFLTRDGHVKILDFGLARREPLPTSGDESVTPTLTQQTEPGTVMGTIGYMAPEQVSGQPGDARSDIFSFGCVLYELLTGSRAFRGKTNGETLAAILRDDPADPMASGRVFPPDLSRIITHCLTRDPSQRFQSAQDLAFNLKAVLAGSAVSVPTTPLPVSGSRARWWAPAAAIVLLAAGVGVFLALRHGAPSAGATSAPIRSLAVLPLEDLSHDPEQEYFADGMTEELNTQLAQIGELRVIAPASAKRYRKTTRTNSEIGRELKVDAIVTGSILRSGGKVRVTAHLIRAATDEQIWAESYERSLEDVMALQGDVARAIVSRIRVKLTAQEATRLSGTRLIDPIAHEAYLKGLSYWNKGRTPEDMSKAIEFFNLAIEKDPSYAAPHAGIAETFLAMTTYGMVLSEDAIRNARPAVMKALELDPQSAEAHSVLGRIRAAYDWNWGDAEREHRLAIELSPNNAIAHQWYSHLLVALGRVDEAMAESRRARDLDPFSVTINEGTAWVLYMGRRFDESIEQGRRTIELDRAFSPAYETVAMAHEAKGAAESAFAMYQKYAELSGYDKRTISALKAAYDTSGLKGYFAKRLEMEKKELAETGDVYALTMAHLFARLDDRDQTFNWLERAYSDRHARLFLLNADPVFDGLHSDPRFVDLLRRIGLPH